jgi:hypothetical protein
VNVKYKTKNNTTDVIPVFLPMKNHRNANMSSARNLMVMATIVCMVWLPSSLLRPLKNMISIRMVIRVNMAVTNNISLYSSLISKTETRINPEASIKTSSNASKKVDLTTGFKGGIIFLL